MLLPTNRWAWTNSPDPQNKYLHLTDHNLTPVAYVCPTDQKADAWICTPTGPAIQWLAQSKSTLPAYPSLGQALRRGKIAFAQAAQQAGAIRKPEDEIIAAVGERTYTGLLLLNHLERHLRRHWPDYKPGTICALPHDHDPEPSHRIDTVLKAQVIGLVLNRLSNSGRHPMQELAFQLETVAQEAIHTPAGRNMLADRDS